MECFFSYMFYFLFYFMPDHFLFFLVQVVFASFLFFLWLNSKLLSLHLLKFLISNIFLTFIVNTNPFKLIDFVLNLVHQNFRRTKFVDFSVGNWGIEYVINFSPLSTFCPINNDQGLTSSICSGSSSGPMNICITIQGYTILNNVCCKEIQSSCCHVCWDQYVQCLWFFEPFKLC